MFQKQTARRLRCASVAALLVGLALLSGCRREAAPPPAAQVPRGPTGAVLRLVRDLRQDDLAGYARHAVPPALHVQLDAAWREGRSRWPLTELPLHARLPGMLTTLATPGAEKALLATYNRQFAGADGELRSAAATVSLFAVQYLQREGDYSDEERDHYIQLVGALARWGKRAPLADARRAKLAIPQLVSAARLTGLAGEGRYAQLGMDRSLRRLGPFFARFKRVLRDYGLDLDAALDSVRVDLAEQTGDTARVRLRYTVAGQDIDAHVLAQRIGGQWYLTDAVRHARLQAAAPAGTADAVATDSVPTGRVR
jgi:hypothetical protein